MIQKLLARAVVLAGIIAAGAASAADHVTVQLGFIPNGLDACFYVGVQQGLYAASDLDVTILPGRGSIDTLSKLGTGVADVGEVSLDAFLAAKAESPVPATAVMSMISKPPDSILTTETTGIVALKDVVGRKIGTPTFTSSNLVWPLILKINGVDAASVTLIKTDPSTLPGMLATEKIDGIIGWATTAPNTGHVLASQGKTLKVIPWAASGYEGYSQSIVASDKTLAERPDVVRRFAKATRAAMIKTYENTTLAAENMKTMIPQGDVSVFKDQIEASKPYMFNEFTDRYGLGALGREHVQKTWGWVSRVNNYPPDKLDPMKFVNATFLGS